MFRVIICGASFALNIDCLDLRTEKDLVSKRPFRPVFSFMLSHCEMVEAF